MSAELQAEVDALNYPPTHTYDVATLRPSGVLAERLELLEKAAPGFFAQHSPFLDIGCNKGFFSALAARHDARVTGIDTDPRFVALCAKLVPAGKFEAVSFRDFVVRQRFSRVFVGNVHHYCYRDSGWAWVNKLAAVCHSGAEVLIEGPEGISCEDARQCLPEEMHAAFTREDFIARLGRFFELRAEMSSVSYTPGRAIYYAVRREDPFDRRSLFDPRGTWELLHENAENFSWVYRTPRGEIAKVFSEPSRRLWESVNVTRHSPWSNGVLGSLVGRNTPWVGWLERQVTGRPFETFEAQETAWQATCERNAWLARLGYIDHDLGGANWVVESGRLTHFDKNSTFPISELTEELWAPEHGRIMQCARSSYDVKVFSPERQARLVAALATRDPVEIRDTFLALRR